MNEMIKSVLDTLKISIEYFKENFDSDKFDITTNFAEYELKSSLEILENYLEKVDNVKGALNCPQCELVEVLKNESRERYVMIERLVEKYKNLKVEYEELSKDELCFEKRCDKFEKVIEILKELGNLYLVKEVNGKDIYYAIVFNGLHSYLEENEYNDFKEVLE